MTDMYDSSMPELGTIERDVDGYYFAGDGTWFGPYDDEDEARARFEVYKAQSVSEPIIFKRLFDAYVATQTKTWEHDRSKTVGASEIFGCIRKAFFAKRGGEQDPDYVQSWGATERGNVIENHFVVPALKHAFGANLLYAGSDQKTLVLGRNSATPDGLAINQPRDALSEYGIDDIGSDCFLIEIKSVDPRVNISKEEKTIHHGQSQQQLGLVRELTDYKPFYTVVIYVDASFFDIITPHVVRFDEKTWRVAKQRANSIWKFNDPAKLMPEGKLDGSCKLCPFTRTCGAATVGSIPDKDNKATDEHVDLAEPLIAQYAAAEAKADAAEKDLSAVKEEIKSFLREQDVRSISKGKGKDKVWGISLSGRSGNTSLDKEAMVADGIDLEKYSKQGAAYDVLTVTLK